MIKNHLGNSNKVHHISPDLKNTHITKKESNSTKPTKTEPKQIKSQQKILKSKINKKNEIHPALQTDVTLDTSSPIHLTNHREWLVDFQPANGQFNYTGVGEKSHINILGQGYLFVKNGTKPSIRINCFLSQDDNVTIISAEKLRKETGYSLATADGVMFNKNNLIRISTINNTVWTSSELLFEKPPVSIRAIRPLNPIQHSTKLSVDESHYRLQHISKEAIENSVKAKIFVDITELTNKNSDDCTICMAGKSKQHNHYRGSMNHYYQNQFPGAAWSLDMFGLLNITNAKADKYMLIMVDNITRCVVADTFPTKEGYMIASVIENNIRKIEKQFDRTVKELVMDRGTEFSNSNLKSFTEKMGIIRRFSSTQDHPANARAEKIIQTIIADVRTLMIQSKLPAPFWKYAVKAAVMARNCVLNKQIKTAPIKLLSPKDIDIYLKSFLPFGTPAVIWRDTKNKLHSNGKNAITLCKDEEGSGYLFLVTKTKEIIATPNFVLPEINSTSEGSHDTISTLNANAAQYNGDLSIQITENQGDEVENIFPDTNIFKENNESIDDTFQTITNNITNQHESNQNENKESFPPSSSDETDNDIIMSDLENMSIQGNNDSTQSILDANPNQLHNTGNPKTTVTENNLTKENDSRENDDEIEKDETFTSEPASDAITIEITPENISDTTEDEPSSQNSVSGNQTSITKNDTNHITTATSNPENEYNEGQENTAVLNSSFAEKNEIINPNQLTPEQLLELETQIEQPDPIVNDLNYNIGKKNTKGRRTKGNPNIWSTNDPNHPINLKKEKFNELLEVVGGNITPGIILTQS